jgi:hypothetical protein
MLDHKNEESDYLNLLVREFNFLTTDYGYTLKMSGYIRLEHYLIYFHKKKKRQVNINLIAMGTEWIFEIRIVKTSFYDATQENFLFCKPKDFKIKEYSDEITNSEIKKDKFKFNNDIISKIKTHSKRIDYINSILNHDIELFKQIIKSDLHHVVNGDKWVDYKKIRSNY